MFNLIAGWVLMWALYVMFMRGYTTPDPRRVVGFEYRRRVGDRFGLLPPSKQPVGVLLWILTAAGFVGAVVLFLVGDRWVGAANATMVGAFLITLWRDSRWLKRQPDYVAERDEAFAAAKAAHDARHGSSNPTAGDDD